MERFESLPFVGPKLVAALKDEALDRLSPLPAGGGPVLADPGPALAALLPASRPRERPSAAHGQRRFRADLPAPRSTIRFRPRSRRAPLSRVCRPGAREPERLFTGPGGMPLLLSRGTVHAQERLSAGERRLLLGIGFAEAPAIS